VQRCLAGVDRVRLRHKCGCGRDTQRRRAGAAEPGPLAESPADHDTDAEPEPHTEPGPAPRRSWLGSRPGSARDLRRWSTLPGRRRGPCGRPTVHASRRSTATSSAAMVRAWTACCRGRATLVAPASQRVIAEGGVVGRTHVRGLVARHAGVSAVTIHGMAGLNGLECGGPRPSVAPSRPPTGPASCSDRRPATRALRSGNGRAACDLMGRGPGGFAKSEPSTVVVGAPAASAPSARRDSTDRANSIEAMERGRGAQGQRVVRVVALLRVRVR
jgi:hypothetical protein